MKAAAYSEKARFCEFNPWPDDSTPPVAVQESTKDYMLWTARDRRGERAPGPSEISRRKPVGTGRPMGRGHLGVAQRRTVMSAS
jgi:hypothetical protein